MHTFVEGDLVPVKVDGKRFVMRLRNAYPYGGDDEWPDLGFRCSGTLLQTWAATSTGTDPVTLEVTSWTLDGATATVHSVDTVSVDRSTALLGNWSHGSCDTVPLF